jgi:hypothetical protein
VRCLKGYETQLYHLDAINNATIGRLQTASLAQLERLQENLDFCEPFLFGTTRQTFICDKAMYKPIPPVPQ